MTDAVAEAIREQVIAKAPSGTRLRAVDFGCGNGVLSYALEHDLAEIFLLDTSSAKMDALEQDLAMRKPEHSGTALMHPLRLDLTREAFPHRPVDILYAMMSLHHVPEPLVAIKAFANTLVPGGHFCLADLAESGQPFHPAGMQNTRDGFRRTELEESCRSAGLLPTSYDIIHYSSRTGPDGVQRRYPIFCLIAQKTADQEKSG